MNVGVKKAWVEALRSGEYRQGRGQLRTGDAYCCLGVLCELAVKAGVSKQTLNQRGDYAYSQGDEYYDTSITYLPEHVIKWAGLNSHNPVIPGRKTLAALNDDSVPFGVIADFIDAHL